jgi:hypothetical protein
VSKQISWYNALINVHPVSLDFTIYKFRAKLKQKERWSGSQGEKQFPNEFSFSLVFYISLVLSPSPKLNQAFGK